MKRLWSEKELITAWADKNLTAKEIARRFGLDPSTISKAAKQLGLEPRTKNKVDLAKLKQLWEAGITGAEIAAKLNISPGYVYNIRMKYGFSEHKRRRRGIPEDAIPILTELNENGFVRIAKVPSKVRDYLHAMNQPPTTLMFGGMGRCSGVQLYSSRHQSRLFGRPLRIGYYAYDIDKAKRDLGEILVAEFKRNNPDPDPGKAMILTRILHQNGQHWESCIRRQGLQHTLKREV